MRRNTKMVGDIAELKAAAYFAELGYYVSRPLTDNAPYDLIIDNHKELLKVQVKSRTEKNGLVVVHTHFKNPSGHQTPFNKSHFDLLFIYVPNHKKAALLNWIHMDNLVNTTQINLRLTQPKNNQHKKIVFFKDFEIQI